MRRLRLSAPQVVGTGMALDPNSVAEYLDNVLPPEQVGDYERICLESDVHLAEAAACHHVLTMVLGEPADVDPRARQRMYSISAEARERKRIRTEPAHIPATATSTIVAAAAPAPASIPGQTTATFEVPEYLRTRAWWQSRAALAGLAAVLLAAVSLYFVSGLMGWFGEAPPVALSDAPPATPTPEPATDSTQQSAQPDQAVMAGSNDATNSGDVPQTQPTTVPTTEASADPYAPRADAGPPALPPPPQAQPPMEIAAPALTGTQPVIETPAVANDEPQQTPAVENSAEPVQQTVAPSDVTTTNVTPPSPLEIAPPDNTAPESTAPTETVPLIPPPPTQTGPVVAEPRIAAVQPDVRDEVAATEEVPAGPLELGTYLGGKTVLLTYNDQDGAWFRVQPRSAVAAGERLLALPEFRPKITLASGVHLDITGGTQVAMRSGDQAQADGLPALDANVPAIELFYGRIILINTSSAEQTVRVRLGPTAGDARLGRNATLAVEVERQYVPGNDPRQTPTPVVATFYAPEGGVAWTDQAGEKTADNPSRWTIADGTTSEVAADPAPPDWIDQEPVVHLSEQRFGAPVVESTLVSDRPIDVQLLELFKGRDRKEVKSLVARSSIYVGLFSPFIDALRDSQQKWPTWKTHIETLRASMAHGPDSAERIWQSLVEQRGRVAAADLYEMLCGYNADQIGRTPDEMKVGALSQLIDWLENDGLDYRVLAVYNLWEITGKQLMPNPAANLTVRNQNVRRWRDRLDSGELRPIARQ
jgi:hypothetical protein